MRAFLKSRVKWSSIGWFWFWAGALLVLPNCILDSTGDPLSSNLQKGPGPHTSVIFCDIELPEARRCALPDDPGDIAGSIRLNEAAMALVAGDTSDRALDDSPDALERCGNGQPELIFFHGPFPEGSPICLNCGVIPGSHPNSTAVCVALCQDLFHGGASNVPPSQASLTWCASNARLSTNYPADGCIDGACSMGALDLPFDPRRSPEHVIWQDFTGAHDGGGTSTLTREALTSGMWDAGAASKQTIEGGDGYVEFTATETTLARMGGLSSGAPPDTDVNFANIGWGIDLFSNGEISIFESGELISTFGPYTAGEKFRVKVKDKFNGFAEISYARIIGPCDDGSPCNEAVFYTSETTAAYPIRVDASLFDEGATLTEVRLVFIH